MSRSASSESSEAQTNIMDQKSLLKSPDQGELSPYPHGATSLHTDANNVQVPLTLESLPSELQLQICREMLRSQEPITISPCTPYVSEFAFGSLGILRVSKYFSTMALGVMYGENCFHFGTAEWTVEGDEFDDEINHSVSLSPCLRRS